MGTERGFFASSDPCWLGGPGAAEVAAAVLILEGEDPALATIARDHALLRQRLGVAPPASGAEVRVVRTDDPEAGEEGYHLARTAAGVTISAAGTRGLLYGYLRLLATGLTGGEPGWHRPAMPIRMLNDWDNLSGTEPLGSVERGYSGPSILFADGRMVEDLSRLRDYARLLSSVGINALSLNNVNVHEAGARLIADRLDDTVRAAGVLREYGIATYLAADIAAPITLGDLDTSDPLDDRVRRWWADAVARVYAAVPDFGGFVVKADSEGRPGPFSYGRTHVDGANMLAEAVAPHGGTVFWRCFVYDCVQDWRDRTTDRARAAADHFAALDGRFADNVVLQIKYGPIDFQPREPVSPLLMLLRATNVAIEFQVTQEYTGQQRHVCYLAELWREVLDVGVGWADDGGPRLADTVRGSRRSGVTAVSNVGADWTWTGHPLAQANLYAFGRLAWDPDLAPERILQEWSHATYPLTEAARSGLASIMLGSWRSYEQYTAPLGVGFMVEPGHHYGPSVDGYEYSRWGTYHFADREGIGVDRTVATGTGMVGLYPPTVAVRYETTETCPDELLLFFHHVPYGHVLHSGATVIQHIYDAHFAGAEAVEQMIATWEEIRGEFAEPTRGEIDARLAEQRRSAREWRDQINTYFFRKSGVPDAAGRRIY